MTNYIKFFLLFRIHIFAVFCVESNLSHVKDGGGLAKAAESSASSKIGLETCSQNSKAPLYRDELNAGMRGDSKVNAEAQMRTDLATITTTPRHHNMEFGNMNDSSRPHDTHMEQELATAPRKSKLRATAAPFVPQPHSRLLHYHVPSSMLAGESSKPRDLSGLTTRAMEQRAPFYSSPFLEFIHQANLKGNCQVPKGRNWVKQVELPAQVIAGFPKAQELQDWFQMIKLSLCEGEERHMSKNFRRKLVKRIAWFKNAYRQVHTPSSLGINEGPNKKPEVMIPKVYEFGHLVLKSFYLPIYMIKSLVKILKHQMKLMYIFKEDHFEKFFFWPVIISGAGEWEFREASTFSAFLKCCRHTEAEINEIEAFMADAEEIHSMNPETVPNYQSQDMNILAKILGEKEPSEETNDWRGFYQNMIKDDYFSLNSRLEEVIYYHFHEETKEYDGQKLYIEPEKLATFCSKWDLGKNRLVTLVKLAIHSKRNRGIYTMSYELSQESRIFFENSLVELTKEILGRKFGKNENIKENHVSQLLDELYKGVKKFNKIEKMNKTYRLTQEK